MNDIINQDFINQDRLVKEFLELVKIPSESRKEGRIARFVKEKLKALGLTVQEDRAGEKIGGEAGNLVAVLEARPPGTATAAVDKPVLLLSSHLDTVIPGENVKPVIDHDIIRSAGDTILGADAKAGIAAILEALRVVKEQKIPHPPLVVVFSVAEELGLQGASNLDRTMFSADMGIVLDSFGPVGRMVTKGPAHSTVNAVIKGKAAHSGELPEAGISAIQIAAEAIRMMKLGRIDGETTANIGTINGGRGHNIIPDEVVIVGEARSRSPEKLAKQTEHMKNAYLQAAAKFGGQALVDIVPSYPHIDLPENAPVVELVRRAAEKMDLTMQSVSTGGGSDANVFVSMGIPTVNITTGMENVHTYQEFIRLEDLYKLSRLVVEIIKEAGNGVIKV